MEYVVNILLGLLFCWILLVELNEDQFSFLKKLIIGSFLAVFFTAQIISDHKKTYPFANWSMYSSANPGLNYVEYILETADGERFHYPFSIISKTSPRAFMTKIRNLEVSYNESERELESVAHELTEHPFKKTIISLVRIYSDENPNTVIRSFEVNGVYYSGNELEIGSVERFNYYTYYPK